MKPSHIKDDEINNELTERAKKDEKYRLFLKWALDNGVKYTKIDFPVAFGPSGIIGIAAKEDIDPLTGFIAIPNKLLITTGKVRDSPIGEIIEDHPQLFEDHEDADFNTLAVYLMYEKLKGKDSFYYPMFNAISDSCLLIDWNKEELERLEDPYLKHEAEECAKEMDDYWYQIRDILSQYPEHFIYAKLDKHIFFTCYEIVMTRCFGWELPETMIVPFADFMNHSEFGTTHFLINMKLEKNDNDDEHSGLSYIQKKRKIDMGFLDVKLGLKQEQKRAFLISSNPGLQYCQRYKEYLNQDKFYLIDKNLRDFNKEAIIEAIHQININILNKDLKKHIWELSFFEETDDEDNDTDDDDEETTEEIFNQITEKEMKKIEIDKEDNDGDKKGSKVEKGVECEGKNTYITELGSKPADDDNNDDDTKPKSNKNPNWSWFKNTDDQNYFLVCTDHTLSYKKSQQVYCCYGRRSNRFLMMWYGFALRNNRYASLSFRLWMKKPEKERLLPEKLIFREYITSREWENGIILSGKMPISLDELSKEFRIKKSKLCEDLLAYLRGYLLSNYKGTEKADILVTRPKSLKYEEYIINFAITLFDELMRQYTTSISEDELILSNLANDFKARYAV